MLNLEYKIKLNKTNVKFLKNTQLILLYMFNRLIKTQSKLIIMDVDTTVKTLMLSPFHYKVAKKNICIQSQNIKLKNINLNFNEEESIFFIINYINILNITNLNWLSGDVCYKFKKKN